MRTLQLAFLLLAVATSPAARADGSCGWSHVDHRVNADDHGPWNPQVYRSSMHALQVADVAGAVWLGADSRLGRTAWQAIDSELLSAVAAEIGKRALARARPVQSDDPCDWFGSRQHRSFPSGETTAAAALVTPFVIEYAQDRPWVLGLLAVPAYIGVARVKNQAHWQTDILAGWAIGGLSSWYAHGREVPLTVELLPDGATVGWRKRF